MHCGINAFFLAFSCYFARLKYCQKRGFSSSVPWRACRPLLWPAAHGWRLRRCRPWLAFTRSWQHNLLGEQLYICLSMAAIPSDDACVHGERRETWGTKWVFHNRLETIASIKCVAHRVERPGFDNYEFHIFFYFFITQWRVIPLLKKS
jgi:hypothetical protein